ncbi:MAG: glycosyltransferase family 2 protein, partial [Candidatus Levybacteria bacterium]|nr:glycosyltransferase family 2 protein [Candidatus Levybacteria bacterium]
MSWEIILVDDGSEDNTWMEIMSLYKSDMRVKGVRLSRNFGHQYALFAGLSQTTGEAVITMDADLQHSPQLIPILVGEWRKGNKIVHTIRSDPKDLPFLKKVTSKLFYKIFSFLSGV